MAPRPRWLKFLAWASVSLAAIISIGPFLLPLPDLEHTVPPRRLAQQSDQFENVGGLDIRYRQGGSGRPAIVLLHGFGANARSWDPVLEGLGIGRTLAFDRVGFGLSERPMAWEGENPYGTPAQVTITLGLMDSLAIESAVLVGHSAGAEVATSLAVSHPRRVEALILESPDFASRPGAMSATLIATPQGQRIARFLARNAAQRMDDLLASAYHDPSRITAQTLDGYRQPLKADNWDRGLALFAAAPRHRDLTARLRDLEVPVLFITGDDDTWVPTSDTVRLSESVPSADLRILAGCGHVAHEECPDAFVDSIIGWLGTG